MKSAQRYHLEVFGCVVIENILTEDEVGRLHEAMQKMRRDLLQVHTRGKTCVRGCRLCAVRKDYLHFAHILKVDPAIFEYLTYARLVAMVEELVGGGVGLEESEAVINFP